MQSKNEYPSFYPKQKSTSLSLTVIMVFRENFSSSVHLSGIRIKLHDTHHIFSFDPSYPFPDSRHTTRSGTTISLHLLLHKPYSFPGHPAHQSMCALPFTSLPIWRAPIIPNRSQHMLAQDRVDLLRLHGWPTEIHVCNWNCLLFSKGHWVLIETFSPVTLLLHIHLLPLPPLRTGKTNCASLIQNKK